MTNKELMDKFLEWQVTTRRCQRNWNDQKVSQEYIDFLTDVATLSPSKQNDRHYGLVVVTRDDILEKIKQDFTWGVHAVTEGDAAMRNSQMLAPLGFVYGMIDREDWHNDWIPSKMGNYTSNDIVNFVDDPDMYPNLSYDEFETLADLHNEWLDSNERDCMGSIMISSGQLTLAASMLGLKTGYSYNLRYNAKTDNDWKEILEIDKDTFFHPRLYVGIGYPDETLPWHVTTDFDMLVSGEKEEVINGNLVYHSDNILDIREHTTQPETYDDSSPNGWGWIRNNEDKIVGFSHSHRSWNRETQSQHPTSQIIWRR